MPPTETPPPDKPRRPGVRLIIWALGVPLLVGLTVAVAIGLWGAHRFQAVVLLAKETQQTLLEMNKQQPFEPPRTGQTHLLGYDQWNAMLNVRESTLRHLPPPVIEKLGALTEGRATEPIGLLRWMLDQPEKDWRAMVSHFEAALSEEGLTPAAYSWMLGLAVLESIRQGTEAGQAYERLLSRIAQMTRATPNGRDDFLPTQAIELLEREYEGQRLNRPEVMRRLSGAPAAGYLIDLAVVTLRAAPPIENIMEQLPVP